VVGEATGVEVFEYGEEVISYTGEEWIGRPVEDLERCLVRLEVAVIDQLLDCLSIGHQGSRCVGVPQAIRVADAVGAPERTALYVVERQPGLAVLDNLLGALR
jgi:hypothetical protein